jgi:prepilin-type N-terminal cleavage/methylation domain-containing protein
MENRVSGFTLVELMVVVLVVGLVVLLFTQIPLFSLSSWRKGTDRLKMQRDARYAMLRIQRKLRPASFTVAPMVSAPDDSTLVIGEDSFYVDGDSQSDFFNDLVQESGGEKEQVVEGDSGTTFQIAIPNASLVTMTFTLIRGNVQTTLRTAVKPRN